MKIIIPILYVFRYKILFLYFIIISVEHICISSTVIFVTQCMSWYELHNSQIHSRFAYINNASRETCNNASSSIAVVSRQRKISRYIWFHEAVRRNLYEVSGK